MKYGKRFLAGVMAAVLAAGALVGCGNGGTVSGTNSGTASGVNSGTVQPGGTEKGTKLLAAANLPAAVAYPDEESYFGPGGSFDEKKYDEEHDAWRDFFEKRMKLAEGNQEGYRAFLADICQKMLADGSVENPAFSPLNIYLSLGMLAEISGGQTQKEILDAVHASSLEDLYEKANALAQAVQRDDSALKVDLGGSLWLSNNFPFNEATVKRTAERYFASIYRGLFGTEEMDQALRDWLNEKTGGLLKDQVEALSFDDPQLAMVLAATIYLKAAWQDEFSEKLTSEDTFHGVEKDTKVPFMHESSMGAYYFGDKFLAIRKGFASGGGMYFVLPKEGVTVAELLEDPEAQSFLYGGASNWEKTNYAQINASVPKFDVTAEYDLTTILKQLGIQDAFNQESADFTPLLGEDIPCWVDQAIHDARVKVDEKGVEAAAFTVYMLEAGAAMPDEVIEFKLDRPFLFTVEGDTQVPLFVGAVNSL